MYSSNRSIGNPLTSPSPLPERRWNSKMTAWRRRAANCASRNPPPRSPNRSAARLSESIGRPDELGARAPVEFMIAVYRAFTVLPEPLRHRFGGSAHDSGLFVKQCSAPWRVQLEGAQPPRVSCPAGIVTGPPPPQGRNPRAALAPPPSGPAPWGHAQALRAV